VIRHVEHVMGMPISLALRGRHAHDTAAWEYALAELRHVDAVFSTYRPDSTISRLGRGEITEAQCPPQVHEVLALARQAERASDGAFSAWPAGALDPNGVVKGWAVERSAAALRSLDDTDFCLSAGGDMLCHGLHRPWRIGIEDPHDTSRVLATLAVHDGAVATSGAAHRGQHIVDARTGLPPAAVASVTVVAASLSQADIDATAAYAQGPAAAEWLDHRVGRIGMVVWADGSTTTVGAHRDAISGHSATRAGRGRSARARPVSEKSYIHSGRDLGLGSPSGLGREVAGIASASDADGGRCADRSQSAALWR
jgi:thiamine biosynthesis lipoprotein